MGNGLSYAHLAPLPLAVDSKASLQSFDRPSRSRFWPPALRRRPSANAAGNAERPIARLLEIGLGHFIHGQVSRSTEAESSLLRRVGQLTYFFDVGWRDPALADAAIAWVNDSRAAMKPYSSLGTYINYLSSDEPSAIQASYGRNYQRLAAIKRKYDPHNVFHRNRNIRPL